MTDPRSRVDCIACDGAGGHPDDGTCKDCAGTGWAPEGTPDPYCVACCGEGWRYGDVPCKACDTTGFKNGRKVPAGTGVYDDYDPSKVTAGGWASQPFPMSHPEGWPND